jgi:hypothetical protein
VVFRIQVVDGVTRTLTCTVIHVIGSRSWSRLNGAKRRGRPRRGAHRPVRQLRSCRPRQRAPRGR